MDDAGPPSGKAGAEGDNVGEIEPDMAETETGGTDDAAAAAAEGSGAGGEELAGSSADAVGSGEGPAAGGDVDERPTADASASSKTGGGSASADVDAPDAEGKPVDAPEAEAPADAQAALPGEVVEAEVKEAEIPPALPRRGSVRMPLPPPVDLDQVNNNPQAEIDLGPRDDASTSSRPRDGSSISPSSEAGRRRRSPQTSQMNLAKQVEDMCARSIHACGRYGNIAKLQDHVVAVPTAVSEKDSAGFTALHFAACYGHTDAVQLLLNKHAQVDAANDHGWTPLHVAARNGHEKSVSALLVAKASVHIEDKHKMTALHNASCSESKVCVTNLLQQGAVVNQQDQDGWTPLHFAARFNNVDIVVLLLSKNADPNVQDRDGWTPMHNSARNGRNRCVQELLVHNSTDLSKTTRYGETPLHIACRKGKAKVVEKIVTWADKAGSDQLKSLLAQTDIDGKTPEDVASTPHIISILKQEHFLGSGLYDINRENSDIDQDATRTKSRSCTIM